MSYYSPQKIAGITIASGKEKPMFPLQTMLVLRFLGEWYISVGYLFDIKVSGNTLYELGFAAFIGAAVFPLRLILILIAGEK